MKIPFIGATPLLVQGEVEIVSRTHIQTTMRTSEWVSTLNMELPDTETVIRQWYRDYRITE